MSQQKEDKLFSIRTKLSYYKVFHRTSISNRNEKKTEILMNKPVYLGLAILELSKILMYEFECDYVKPEYGKKAKLCQFYCMHKNRLYLQRYCRRCWNKIWDLKLWIRKAVKGKNEIVIEMKHILGRKITTKFVGLRAKTYSYLIDDGGEDKKAKGATKCVIKRKT